MMKQAVRTFHTHVLPVIPATFLLEIDEFTSLLQVPRYLTLEGLQYVRVCRNV